VATKFESAELKLKPLAPREILAVPWQPSPPHPGHFRAGVKDANLLVERLNLLLGSIVGRLLFDSAPLFQSLDFLVERLNFLFQGLNLRDLRGVAAVPSSANNGLANGSQAIATSINR